MKRLKKTLFSILAIALVISVSGVPAFAATYDKTNTVYMIGQGHQDTGWTWDYPSTLQQMYTTFDRQLENIKNNPGYKFTYPAMLHYQWLKEYDPIRYDKVLQQIRAGNWEVSGGQWVEPDANMPDGESVARQFLYGKLYARKELGVDPKMAYLPDSFGHAGTLPQIYKKSGMDFFVETKLDGNSRLKVPYLMNWKSQDGTSILTMNSQMYNWTPSGGVSSMNGIMDKAAPYGLKTAARTFGDGDRGGGPQQSYIDTLKSYNTAPGGPSVQFATIQEYYNSIKDQDLSKVADFNDELYLDSRRGTYSNGASEKYLLRKSYIKAEDTEKFAYIADWIGAAKYPYDKITKAWDIITTNQFHDHVNGTWMTADMYDRVINNYGISMNYLDKVENYSFNAISQRADTSVGKDEVPITVFNPLSWARNDAVETTVTFNGVPSGVSVYDDKGNVVPSQILSINGKVANIVFEANDVPSIGYKVFKAVPVASTITYKTGLSIGSNVIENRFIKASVDPATGNLSSVYLKKDNWESVSLGSNDNELHYFVDNQNARDLDAKDIFATPTLLNNPLSITLLESGPVRSTYRIIKKTPAGSEIVQDVTMYSNIDRVDIINSVDWNEQHKMLKASFTVNLNPSFVTYDQPFGTIDRPVLNNSNMMTDSKFEVVGHKWADMSANGYGVSIFNDSKYGWDAVNNRLRLSLLRSPNSNDPRFEVGHYDYTYSIYPHSGDWKSANTVYKSYEMNYPMTAKQVSSHSGSLGKSFSFISVDQPNIIAEAVKKVEDGTSNDMILRLYEINGQPNTTAKITFASAINSAREVNLIEEDIGSASYSGNELVASFGNNEIKSYRISLTSQNFRDDKPIVTQVDLGSYFNRDGISYNSNRTDGSLDKIGSSYAAELIPSNISSEDISFTLGSMADGANNVVESNGQTINLPAGKYDRLYILGAAVDGGVTELGNFTLNYSDNSKESQYVAFRNWTSKALVWGTPVVDDNMALRFTHRHLPTGDQVFKDTYMYMYLIGLDKNRTVTSITLPKNSKIKIMAVSLATGVTQQEPVIPNVKPDNKAPDEVSGVKVQSGNGQLKITWNDPANNDFSKVKITGEGTTIINDVYVDAGVESAIIEGLENEIAHSFKMMTIDCWGNVSAGVIATGIPSAATNVALGKAATASSQQVGKEAYRAVDGVKDISHKWNSSYQTGDNKGDKWLKIDLGRKYLISRYVVTHAQDESSSYFTKDFKIKISDTGDINGPWTTVDEVWGNKDSETDRRVTPFTARYVMLVIVTPSQNGTNANDNARIDEFELYGFEVPVLDKISLNTDKVYLKSGKTDMLSLSGIMSDGVAADLSKAQIVYTSDNEQVAKVDGSGTVTAIEEGNATIKASVTLLDEKKEGTSQIIVDNTPPGITVTGAVYGEAFKLNQQVTVSWAVYDNLSGIESAKGDVISGEKLDTSTPGAHTINFTASDKAGNVMTNSITYYVQYAYSGVLQPLSSDGSSTAKLGSTVPVKFQLKDAAGSNVTNATAKLYIAKIIGNSVGEETAAISTSASSSENTFRYESTDNQYIFNLNTKNLTQGTYQLRIDLGDGTVNTVIINLK